MNGTTQCGSQALQSRLILLGASNLTVSLRTVIRLMQERCGGPSEVLVAAGHGRSYGRYSRVLVRGLPGIVSSGLWSHLDSTALPTYALLTDIGNDIAYGHTPRQLLKWVDTCVQRLHRSAARIVMTNVPLASIEALTQARYRFIRMLLFPSSGLTLRQAIHHTRLVHGGLSDIADQYRIPIFEQEPTWFGPDAVHIHYRKRKELFRRIVERFPATADARHRSEAENVNNVSWRRRPRFARMTLWGRERLCRQPSGLLNDGTSVYLY